MRSPWHVRVSLLIILSAVISEITAFPTHAQTEDTSSVVLHLKQVGTRAFVSLTDITPCDSSLIITTLQDLHYTPDSGSTWVEVATPLKHKTVVDVLPQGDTLYVLTANGAVHISENAGLSWKILQRHRLTPNPNRLMRRGADVSVSYVDRPDQSATIDGDTYTVRDSTLTIDLAIGVRCTMTSVSFTEVSCLEVSPSAIYLGMRRAPIVSLNRQSLVFNTLSMGVIEGEYINTILYDNGYLYAGVISGRGGLCRRAELGTLWEYINIDRAVDALDILALVPSAKGIYIGSGDQGVAFLPQGGYVAYPIHDGLHDAVNQSTDRYGDDLLVTSRTRGLCLVSECGRSIRYFSKTIPFSAEYVAAPIGKKVIVGLTDGTMLRTVDEGRTWDTLALRFEPSSINRMRSIDGNVIICTTTGMLISRDSGSTWSPFIPEISGVTVNDVFRIPHGWIVSSSGTALICSDAGTIRVFNLKGTYQHKPLIHNVTVKDGVIYAAGYPGIFTSKNNGVDWDVFYVADVLIAQSITIVGERFYVAGMHGRIYTGMLPLTQ